MSSPIQSIEDDFRRIIRDPDDAPRLTEHLLHFYAMLVVCVSDASLLQFHTMFARVSYLITRYHLPRGWSVAFQLARKEMRTRTMRDEELQPLLRGCIDILLGIGKEDEGIVSKVSMPPIPDRYKKAKQDIAFRKAVMRVQVISWDKANHAVGILDEAEPDWNGTVHYHADGINDIFSDDVERSLEDIGLPLSLALIDVTCTADHVCTPSYIVIMPDLLVDVTSVSEFIGNGAAPLAVNLLHPFLPNGTSDATLIGRIANYFLDELLRDRSQGFQTLFGNAFRLYPIECVRLTDDQVRQMMQSLKEHYHRILHVMTERFPAVNIDPGRCVIEPSFFSPSYGIKGRLDVFHLDRTTQSASIIELKSGKPFKANSYGLSATHYQQTLLYELLIRSAFPQVQRCNNFILYSGVAEDTLRYAASIASIQKETIHHRNQLVLLQLWQSRLGEPGSRDVLQEIDPALFPQVKGFVVRDAQAFKDVYTGLSSTEKQYLQLYTAFITREHLMARIGSDTGEGTGGLAGLWLDDIATKEEHYRLLRGLRLMEVEEKDGHTWLHFSRTEKTNALANFRAGDIAILYPYSDQAEANPTQHQLYRGNILTLDATSVSVRLRNHQVETETIRQVPLWNAEHDLLDSSFRSLYQSLWRLMCAPSALRALVMGLKPPASQEELLHPIPTQRLSPAQYDVFAEGIKAPHLYLLWGPPGTGKTSIMLRAWVEWYLLHTDARLLLLAYTNKAVDEICAAIDGILEDNENTFIRIGSRAGTGEVYRGHLLDEVIAPLQSRAAIRQLLDRTRVFVGTVASVQGKSELFDLVSFDVMMVDEASQLLEPAIVGLLTMVRKTILIGDHMQLPAVSVQKDGVSPLRHHQLEKESGLSDLRMSYFERMYRWYQHKGWMQCIGTLYEQGRMHEDIMKFPNQYVYHGWLRIADEKRQSEQLQAVFPQTHPLLTNRIVFVPSSIGATEMYARYNMDEVQIALEIVELWQHWMQEKQHTWSIGIITPFRAQIAAIHHHASARRIGLADISVDTVERYQGGARDIIIMTCAVNHSSMLERISSTNTEGIDRKLNVAVTRARQQFILIGAEEILQKMDGYRQLMEMSVRISKNDIT